MNRAARVCLVLGVVALLGAFALTTRSGTDPGVEVESARPPAAGAPGSTPAVQETLAVSVTPCRIVDTREASDGALGASPRSFVATGTGSFPSQGGQSLGCGIPAGATAVNMSVSVVNPTGTGFLRVWPQGLAEPQATLANFQTNDSTSVTAVIPVSPSTGRFTVRSSRATHLVVDVIGYTVPQLHAVVLGNGTLTTGSSRATTSIRTSTGKYTVTFNRSLAGCTANASTQSGSLVSSASAYIAGQSVYVTAWRSSAGVLVTFDQPVNVSVTC